MPREECIRGFFGSFDYSSNAMTEMFRYFKQTGRIIAPLTVGEIAPAFAHGLSRFRSALDEQFAHKRRNRRPSRRDAGN